MAENADPGALMAWVKGVRQKFALGNEAHDYWRGYEACLADVERLAVKWASPDAIQ